MHTQRTLAARTLRPGYVHNACWAPCRGRVAARTQQCRCSPWSQYKIVSQHNFLPRAVSRVLSHVSQRAGGRIAAPLRRVVGCWASYRSLYRCPYHDTKVAPKPRYKPLYRDLPLVRPCARASCAGRVVGRSWPYRRAVSQVELAIGWAEPKLTRIFLATILATQLVLKTELVRPNSLLKEKKKSGRSSRVGPYKVGPYWAGPNLAWFFSGQ